MPAPNSKASLNGNAKHVAASSSGTATPLTSKDTSDSLATFTSGKPDKKAHDAEQAKFKSEIDILQAHLVSHKLNYFPGEQEILIHWRQSTVRDKIGFATKAGPGNDRRNALRAELDSIRDQQSTNKHSRAKFLDQIKAIQDGVQKKV